MVQCQRTADRFNNLGLLLQEADTIRISRKLHKLVSVEIQPVILTAGLLSSLRRAPGGGPGHDWEAPRAAESGRATELGSLEVGKKADGWSYSGSEKPPLFPFTIPMR